MANKNTTKNGEYNAKLISDLLLAAKGPHRTGAEFCQECGISAPTFSRYVNMHNKRPCPVEILKKVAEHAAPNSNVTYEQLISANGGNEEDDYSDIPKITINEMIGVITTTLLFSKYECQYPDDTNPIDIMGLTYRPSWSIDTNAIDASSKKRWDFFLWNQLAGSDVETERFIRQLLIIIGAAHLGYIHFDKLTFVFSSTSLYQAVLERTNQLKLDICISFLLIDPVTKRIEQEHHVASTQSAPLSILSPNNSLAQTESTLLSVDKNNLL